MAPLSILFNPAGTAAWVTFHGSWDRSEPVGYKLSVIAFDGAGQPTEPSTSTTAARDIVANADNSKCPDACFRPVGLAFDSQGRLFMSSDATGEIYAVLRADGGKVSDQAGGSGNGTGTTTTGTSGSATGSAPAATTSSAATVFAADIAGMSALAAVFAVVAFVL